MKMLFIDRPDDLVEIEIRDVEDGDLESVISKVGASNVGSIEIDGGSMETVPDVVSTCRRLSGLVVTGCGVKIVPDWLEGMNNLIWLLIETERESTSVNRTLSR